MRGWATWTLTFAAVAGLAALVIMTARSGSSGAPSGDLLVAPAARTGTQPGASDFTSCRLSGRNAGLTITGPCSGRLPAELSCVTNENTTLIAQVPSRDGRILTLSIFVPFFDERLRRSLAVLDPAQWLDYGVQIYAQVSPAGESPRWSQRHASVLINQDTRMRFHDVELLPELGTAAAGTMTLAGEITVPCLREPRSPA